MHKFPELSYRFLCILGVGYMDGSLGLVIKSTCPGRNEAEQNHMNTTIALLLASTIISLRAQMRAKGSCCSAKSHPLLALLRHLCVNEA